MSLKYLKYCDPEPITDKIVFSLPDRSQIYILASDLIQKRR